MAPGNDVFADLLGSKGSQTRTGNKTLAEMKKNGVSSASNAANSTFDISFLDSCVGSTANGVTSQQKAQGDDIIDLGLGNMSLSSKGGKIEDCFENMSRDTALNRSTSPFSSANNHTAAMHHTESLLDGFDVQTAHPAASQPVQTSYSYTTPSYNATQTRGSTPSQMSHSGSLLDGFEVPVTSCESESENKVPGSRDSHGGNSPQARDHALAELLDMGFPLDDANTALDSTPDGESLEGAIAYLMSRAHNSTKRVTPPPQDDLAQYATGLLGKASTMFNVGKKKLQKELNAYMGPNAGNTGDTPAWMAKAEVHAQRASHAERAKRPESVERADRSSQGIPQRPPQGIPVQTRNTPTPPRSLLDGFDAPSRSNPSSESIPINHRRRTTPTPAAVGTAGPKKAYALVISPLDTSQGRQITSLRQKASQSFQLGDYSQAVDLYQQCIQVLAGHPLRIMFQSNLALAYSKLGNPKGQLAAADAGIELIRSITESQPQPSELAKVDLETGKNLKGFWVKLLGRRAEALEAMERWLEAKECYEQLVGLGETSKSVMDGKSRCTKALAPKAPVKPAKPTQPVKSVAKPHLAQTQPKGEAVSRLRQANVTTAQLESQKVQLHDQTQAALTAWRAGNEANIRALLTSLDRILWPELNWKPVALTDLVLDNKVKVQYMKAVAKVHPDKIPKGTSVERQMVAEGVFVTLNQAWEAFKAQK